MEQKLFSISVNVQVFKKIFEGSFTYIPSWESKGLSNVNIGSATTFNDNSALEIFIKQDLIQIF